MEGIDTIDWSELATRWNGRYSPNQDHCSHLLEIPNGNITIVVDTPLHVQKVLTTTHELRLLRARAPFISIDDLRLAIAKHTWWSRLLRRWDLRTGNMAFDSDFRVLSNQPEHAKRMLASRGLYGPKPSDHSLLSRFLQHPWLELTIDEPEPWHDQRRFKPSTLQISFQTDSVDECNELHIIVLVEVFRGVLDQLLALKSARDADPRRYRRKQS